MKTRLPGGGAKKGLSGVEKPIRLSTGREWDKETGTYHYRKRTYDPMDGRFISEDPIGFEGGINLFNYVQSNPVNLFDPYGLFGVGGSNKAYPGHGDFTGSWTFDYNREDRDYTRPFPGIGDPERHFRDLPIAERDVENAITSCNIEAFERAMHRGQDYFSHYSKGYRWFPGNKALPCSGYGHGCVGTKPDEDKESWYKAEAWTIPWVLKWNNKCSCKK